jgi:hypothetical protein
MDKQPWFLRSSDRVDLVAVSDPAVKSSPKDADGVAPLADCKMRDRQKPTVFECRPLTTPEHLNLGGISLRALTDNALYERISAVCYQVAAMVVVEVRFPDGQSWDNAAWRERTDHVDPELVAGLGFWAIMESARDPLGSGHSRPSPRISTASKKSTASSATPRKKTAAAASTPDTASD